MLKDAYHKFEKALLLKSNPVYIAPPELLSPRFDIFNTGLTNHCMKRTEYKKLTMLQKDMCDKLIANEWQNPPAGPAAYCTHWFSHIWMGSLKNNNTRVELSTIVPQYMFWHPVIASPVIQRTPDIIARPTLAWVNKRVGIPRIIHQFFESPEIPDKFVPYVASWATTNPTYKYRAWYPDTSLLFMTETYPELLGVYNGYRSDTDRSNLLRACVMYEYGGVFASINVESVKSLALDSVYADYTLLLARMPVEYTTVLYNTQLGLTNDLIASAPGHGFWQRYINEISRRMYSADDVDKAGSEMMTQVFLDMDHNEEGFLGVMNVGLPQEFCPAMNISNQVRIKCVSNRSALTIHQQLSCSLLAINNYITREVASDVYTVWHDMTEPSAMDQPYQLVTDIIPKSMLYIENE